MADTNETVAGGALPDWDVTDLPEPPKYQFGKAFRSILGPGIIALGGSIGSGEWLLGPAITAQYGGTLLWVATVAILLQVIPQHRGDSLYTLYRRADVEWLHALQAGCPFLGIFLFRH